MSAVNQRQINALIAACKNGDRLALAKLLSHSETMGSQLLQYADLLSPKSHTLRIGITGPPGAGKSTLSAVLLKKLHELNFSVAVIAVDPSSTFTRGAILGDRLRFDELPMDEKVFIRSVGTRGSQGGLSAAVYLMSRIFEMAKFDFLFIETVGVGQTELEIMHVADHVCVVVVPESGDSIQAMKAGLMEIADTFIVNKKDRPGAERMVQDLQEMIEIVDVPKSIKVFSVSATQKSGVDELLSHLINLKTSSLWKEILQNRKSISRLQAEAKALLRQKNEIQLDRLVAKVDSPFRLQKLFQP